MSSFPMVPRNIKMVNQKPDSGNLKTADLKATLSHETCQPSYRISRTKMCQMKSGMLKYA